MSHSSRQDAVSEQNGDPTQPGAEPSDGAGSHHDFPSPEAPTAQLGQEQAGSTDATLAGANIDLAEQAAAGIPRAFGDYELLQEIARGGMGVVYRARQESLDRIVALKMIRSGQLAGSAEVQRFQAEAKAAASLSHPGVVPIYEVGVHDGQHFFSMAYVDGPSLAERLTEGPLPPREAAQLLMHLAEAVQFAHEQGVIHRDLKPGNILLPHEPPSQSRGGAGTQAQITDFGLAKQITGQQHLTATGEILGTPSYMPPEQAAGHVHRIGPAADIYALGAVLYAALTARPPFQAATAWETVRQVIEQQPVSPRSLNPAVDRDLETICLKALDKNPQRRYRTAAVLGEDLRRWLNGEPIRARRMGVGARGWRWCRRKPLVAAMILALTFSLVGGAIVSGYFAVRATRYAGRLEHQLYVDRVNRAYREWQGNDLRLAEDLLAQCPPQHRNWEWLYCQHLCRQELLIFTRHVSQEHMGETYMAGVLDLAIHPDARRVASAGADGQVYIWDIHTGEVEWALPPQARPVYSVDFSPDGRLLAAGGHDGVIRIYDVAARRLRHELRDHREWVLSLDFSPDSEQLVSAGGGWGYVTDTPDHALRVWDVARGEVSRRLEGSGATVRSVAFASDGKSVASAGMEAVLRIWDASSAELVREIATGDALLHCVAFSPDGRWCATGGFDGVARLWDLAAGAPVRSLRGHRSFVRSIEFSPDGSRVVTSSEDNTVKLWDAATGEVLHTYRGHREFTNCAVFDPQARRIISASDDATVRVWDAAGPTTPVTLGRHEGWVDGVAFHPAGRMLATTSRVEKRPYGELTLWDLDSRRRMVTTRVRNSGLFSVAYRPGGREIAASGWEPLIWIFDARTGEQLRQLPVHDDRVHTVAFHPTGEYGVSSSNDGSVRLWNPDSGDVLRRFQLDAQVRGLAVSPDGRLLAAVSRDDRLYAYDLQSHRELWRAAAPTMTIGHTHLAFSPDSREVAMACRDGAVRLYHGRTGEPQGTLHGHSGPVYQVAYNPDGTRLASGGRDKTIKLWDPATGAEVFTLRGHTGTVITLAFSHDGETIVSGGVDHSVRMWTTRAKTGESPVQTHPDSGSRRH